MTSYTSTLQIQLALTPEDFIQQRSELVERLSQIYGQPISLELQAGSVIASVIAVAETQSSLLALSSALSDEARLSESLQVQTEVAVPLSVEEITIEVPVDVEW